MVRTDEQHRQVLEDRMDMLQGRTVLPRAGGMGPEVSRSQSTTSSRTPEQLVVGQLVLGAGESSSWEKTKSSGCSEQAGGTHHALKMGAVRKEFNLSCHSRMLSFGPPHYR